MQARARRAERGAQRQLAAALQQARQEHHADVHAAEQQHPGGDETHRRDDRQLPCVNIRCAGNQRDVTAGVEELRVVAVDVVNDALHLAETAFRLCPSVERDERRTRSSSSRRGRASCGSCSGTTDSKSSNARSPSA